MISKAIFFILVLSVACIIGFVTAWLYFKRKWEKPLGELQGEMLRVSARIENKEVENASLNEKLLQKKVLNLQSNSSDLTVTAHRSLNDKSQVYSKSDDTLDANLTYNNLLMDNQAMLVKVAQLQKDLDTCKQSKQQPLFFTDANPEEKDDLKLIHGIGPFIEQKLNKIGIYNFMQISNFDKDLIDRVTSAIEFFPGRIERDNWVNQAKILDKSKDKA
jgi:predicted flap endonuclease-1-like 5' DNA nuclease